MKKIIIILILIINVNADYINMKITDFINVVATQNQINIVTDKSIEKTFNFYINKHIDGKVNVSVLQDILNSNGFILLRQTDSYYLIKQKNKLLINKIKIYNIKYANTKKVKNKCEKILKGYFRNIKTVKVSRIKKNFTPLSERKKNSDNSNIQTTQTENRIEYSVTVLDNKHIAVTYKDDFVPLVVDSIVENMDKKPVQIRVSLIVNEVKTSALKELGAELNIKLGSSKIALDSSTKALNGLVKVGFKSNDYTNALAGMDISAVINALQSKGDSKIIAQPSVLLYEGKSSTLKDGKTFPIRNTDTGTTNSTTTVNTTNYTTQTTGLTINLKFNEMREKYLFLTMSLKINLVQDYNINIQQLITVDRELTNDMRIIPGQKIEIAGLTNKVKSKQENGIPFLMNIPWIGKLFQYNKNVNNETILIIELKADIIK